MDLSENGKLLRNLRKAKGMTQKQIADSLGIQPKTVSKWETGHGFPDVSTLSALADLLGVSESTLLSGRLVKNACEVGNMKKLKFYICPHCGSFFQGLGESRVVCCGKQLKPSEAKREDEKHAVTVSEIEDDFYVEFNHEMSKEHYIVFVAYVTCDRVLTVRLYPEQDSALRFSKMYGGKLYYYCNRHGLFACTEMNGQHRRQDGKTNLTALLSAFSRAYHFENCKHPVFCDSFARRLFTDQEYGQIEGYIRRNGEVKTYINKQLAPVPLARARFCEDRLKTALLTGTEQYVILGSGFDTFSLRNADLKIPVFEVDKPDMIEEKKRRIERAGLKTFDNARYVAADLSADGLEKALIEKGFDKKKKTFFSCLGLLYYLTKEEIEKLFAKIAEISADGSTLLFDFADNHFFSSGIRRVAELIKNAKASGQPMLSCFGYGELEKVLQQYNFYIYEFLNDKDMQERYFSSCDDEVTAFEHVNYALAVFKP